MKAETNLIITPDGRVVPEGTESGFLWRLAGEEISDEEAERFGLAPEPPRIVEPEVRRTRRRKE
jgi:hypothetical protein